MTRLIWRRWKGRYPTGIDRVCLAYLDHFGDRAQAVIQHDRFRRILGRRASRDLFALLAADPRRFRSGLPAGILANLGQLNALGKGRFYLNIGHTGLNSDGLRQWVARADVRPIYLVHDLIPITHPEFCRPGEADKHRHRISTVLRTAEGVIGNSQFTLDELGKFARREGLPETPGLAAWLGSDALPQKPAIHEPRRPTFVMLGTIEGRKNHEMILKIWRRLVGRLGDAAPRLLVIGQRGWEAEPVFAILDQPGLLRDHVVELNRCPDDELARHLASAHALLIPSMVEGFGLPLMEALAAGTPVIASDVPVFREIGAGIPTFVPARDESGWEAAILDYASSDSASRRSQLEKIRTFKAPSWPDHFKQVENWLATLG